MVKSFSLTFPQIRWINDHQQNPHQDKFIRFCQQHILDRIVALSLPLFASLDVLFHLTVSVGLGVFAGYKSLVYLEKFSIDSVKRHLKISWLFTKVIVSGAIFALNPHAIGHIFDNSISKYVRSLLLSGNPEIFVNPDTGGGIAPYDVLDVFCDTIKQLPEDIQFSMKETLKLVEETYQFEKSITPLDWLLFFSCENGFRRLEKNFETLKSIEGNLFTKLLKKEIPARFEIFMTTTLGLIATPFSLYISINILLSEIFRIFFTHYDTDIKNIFWRLKLDLIALIRMYMTFPLALIGGMIDPFTVQRLLLSPLYKNDKKITEDTLNQLFKKIEKLNTGNSTLIPLTTYTSDPNKNETHGFYIVITKQATNYRLSIINRGWGSEGHKLNDQDQNYLDGDVSYDDISIKIIVDYLSILFAAKDLEVANKAYKADLPHRFKELGMFRFMIYFLPAIWAFKENSTQNVYKSKHARSPQKIGNCAASNLFGAISFHSAMQTGDMRNKAVYKKFIYYHKKQVYENYGYLLDFDLQTKVNIELPSTLAEKQLNKMKLKLKKTEPILFKK